MKNEMSNVDSGVIMLINLAARNVLQRCIAFSDRVPINKLKVCNWMTMHLSFCFPHRTFCSCYDCTKALHRR